MKCKIFTAKNGYLIQGIGNTPILIEDAINTFLEQFNGETQQLRFLQSQSGDEDNYLTLTIFY